MAAEPPDGRLRRTDESRQCPLVTVLRPLEEAGQLVHRLDRTAMTPDLASRISRDPPGTSCLAMGTTSMYGWIVASCQQGRTGLADAREKERQPSCQA